MPGVTMTKSLDERVSKLEQTQRDQTFKTENLDKDVSSVAKDGKETRAKLDEVALQLQLVGGVVSSMSTTMQEIKTMVSKIQK